MLTLAKEPLGRSFDDLFEMGDGTNVVVCFMALLEASDRLRARISESDRVRFFDLPSWELVYSDWQKTQTRDPEAQPFPYVRDPARTD